MGTMDFLIGGAASSRAETEPDEQHRLADEADARHPDRAEIRHQRTLRALSDVNSGRLIDDEAMQAWADSLNTDHELPAPHGD